jgi:hypothetical protein
MSCPGERSEVGGTSLIGAGKLSPCRIFVRSTGAVSRYKLSRSQEFVKVQDFNCGQMCALPTEAERRWVSGCKNHCEFVLGAGAKVEEHSDEIPLWRDKNCDEQLTHIVRVMCCAVILNLNRYQRISVFFHILNQDFNSISYN